MTTPRLAGLPAAVRWLGEPAPATGDGTTLTMTAGPATDWFVDPDGSSVKDNAPYLYLQPEGDFTLGCRVAVDFAATFDAGALAVHAGGRAWAKLCFEYSPHGQPMVVSVVTRGTSDDANAWEVGTTSVLLRLSRIDDTFAFHASTEGRVWSLIRYFTIEGATTAKVGFLAQAPTGQGCRVTFQDVRFEPERLADIRDGS